MCCIDVFTMKCVQFLLYYYLAVSVIFEVGSIKNYPVDKNLISHEDRRGAEKLEHDKPSKMSESESSETKKRGLFLSALHRSPTSLIHPGLAIGYKEASSAEEGYDSQKPTSVLGSGRPQYSFTDSRGGYVGHYPNTYYPAEYGGGFGHGDGGLYGHSGGGFEYPAYGPPSTGIGHHGGGGGGFKNPLALKSLLLPLAGIALLGAAAALTANPVLLQLGVINGRRRRRGLAQVSNNVYPANHVIKPHKN